MQLRAGVAVVLVAFIAAACKGDESQSRASRAESSEENSTPSPSPWPIDDRFGFDVQRIAEQVATLRYTEFRHPVKTRLLGNAGWVKLQRTRARRIVRNSPLSEFGLFPLGDETSKLLHKIRLEYSVGLYASEKDVLYVRRSPGFTQALQKLILAHEFAHAIQDQIHGITYFTATTDYASTDEAVALLALAEGDAIRTERLWADNYGSPGVVRLSERMRRAARNTVRSSAAGGPRMALLDYIEFPYERGYHFVNYLETAFGQQILADFWETRPKTTEHILHPDTYMRGESWISPEGSAPGPGWKSAGKQWLGELDVRLLVSELGTRRANRVASGWNGAIAMRYKRGPDRALGVHMAFDTRRHSKQACAGIADWFRAALLASVSPQQVVPVGTQWAALGCRERRVDFALAPDAESARRPAGL